MSKLDVVAWIYPDDAKCLDVNGSCAVYQVEQISCFDRPLFGKALVRQSDAMAVIAGLESAWQVETMVRKDAIIEKQERHNDELKARIKALESENARLREAREYLRTGDHERFCQVVDSLEAVIAGSNDYAELDAPDNGVMSKNQPQIDTSSERVENSAESMRVDWPEDDNRIDTIGQNGNTGAHYGNE